MTASKQPSGGNRKSDDMRRRIGELEEELAGVRQSQQFYHQLYEASLAGNVVLQADGTIVAINRNFVASLGYAKEELVGKKITQFIVPEDRRLAMNDLRAAFKGQTTEARAFDLIGKDSIRTIWVASGYARIEAGDSRQCILVSGMDITERKRATEALRESERRFRELLQNVNLIAVLLDLKGNVTFCNDFLVRTCGCTKEEVLAHNWFEKFIPPEIAGQMKDVFRKMVKLGDVPPHYENDVLTHDGQRRRIAWNNTILRNPQDDAIIGTASIGEDITEQRHAEAALADIRHKLTTAREEERRRLARDLHDSIGQSLVAMQLELANAPEECKRCKQTPFWQGISDRCARAVREIRQVCYGLYPPTLEPLGLSAALKELLKDYRNHVKISSRFSEAFKKRPLSEETRIALFRIAQEAVQNAVRHSKASRIDLKALCRGKTVVLSVEDNGVGFDVEALRGRGVGLHSMQDRAEAVEGNLQISSQPGRTVVQAQIPTDR